MRLLLLFDDSFNSIIAKLGYKSIDARVGIDWKLILELKIFVCWILVCLYESNIGDGVDYLDLVLCGFERCKYKFFGMTFQDVWVDYVAAWL